MMKRMLVGAFTATLAAAGAAAHLMSDHHPLPDGFVYLDEAIPNLVIDLRYATKHNFVGQRIDGYRHAHAVLSAPAAAALVNVQAVLRPFGLGLKVFDAYRPQRAVDHFVRWGKGLDDRRTKPDYYPDVAKENLFKESYIASRSSHSRGSTVDVTIVYRDSAGLIRELDMGSRFGFSGPISWPDSREVTPQQRANRTLLQSLMRAYGFLPYTQEWWHFTLAHEPYPGHLLRLSQLTRTCAERRNSGARRRVARWLHPIASLACGRPVSRVRARHGDRLELLLGCSGDQPMAAVEQEVGNHRYVDRRAPESRRWTCQEHGRDRRDREREREPRRPRAARGPGTGAADRAPSGATGR